MGNQSTRTKSVKLGVILKYESRSLSQQQKKSRFAELVNLVQKDNFCGYQE